MNPPNTLCTALIAALAFAATATATNADPNAPADIVDLAHYAPDIAQDIRYQGNNNPTGRPLAGYLAANCLLTRAAAQALVAVQQQLQPFGYALKVYDCYRPQSAVADLFKWAKRPTEQRMKARFFPGIDKRQLVDDGYIAARSDHSRASSVDLTIIELPAKKQPAFDPAAPQQSCEAFQNRRFADNGLDMATGYDCFSRLSATDHPDVGLRAHSNRQLLKTLMEQQGFVNLPTKWWHYRLQAEPYPNSGFNFPVQ